MNSAHMLVTKKYLFEQPVHLYNKMTDCPHFIGRVNDLKTGTLVGVDKYGNKYYEDKKHYFFGESVFISSHWH